MKDQLKAYEKFSYYVHLIYESQRVDGASGCFVSYKNKTYFLTNYHVIPGWNPQLRSFMEGSGVKEVYIQNARSETGKFGTYGISISYISRNVSNIFFLDQPNIMLLEIDPTAAVKDFKLDVINLDHLTDFATDSTVFSIGFPGNANKPGGSNLHQKNTHFISGTYSDDHSDLQKLGILFPNNYPQIGLIKEKYQAFQFYFKELAPQGMSGSPIFFVKNLEFPEVEFAGLISGSYTNVGFAVGIKRQVIIYYLDLMQKYGLRFLDYNKLSQHSYHSDFLS